MTDDGPSHLWQIVRQESGRYSVWPAAKAPPDGWIAIGAPARKAECLQVIQARWIDNAASGLGRQDR
jgi:MbtH protein